MPPSQRTQQRLGLPEGFKVSSAYPFKGMNQSGSRIAIEDSEFFWLENYVRIGDGKLRTVWDSSASFYATPTGKTILPLICSYNIGQQDYFAVFFSDGTANQVSYPAGAVTTITANAGLFYQAATGQLPAFCQAGGQYLLLANNNTANDYWLWDGTVLYQAGGIAPVTDSAITDGGSGYTSVPGYEVFGGSGTGVVLTPVIAEGSVVSLTVVNPGTGYLPGEIVQVAFSGGGSDSSAILEAVLATDTVTHLTLVSGGLGYTNGVFALGFSGGGGSGATGTFQVVGGVVTAVNLTNGGSGYTSTPTVSFSASAGGSGAAAVPVLNQAAVASISVINGGSGFSGTPTLTLVGGGGSGATATCTVASGVITAVTVTNGGSGYDSPPAVVVQAGVNNAAAATLALMPFGVSGISLETYQSRVWIPYPNQQGKQNNGGTFFVSAPGSLTDFATSDGGSIFTNSDRFLRQRYVFMRQTSNFLYAAGDSSVSVISNPQTGGSPISTTFSYQNTDPQIGAALWRDTAQDFSNNILFANPFGVYGVYGGSVRKVSKKIDDIFTNAVFPINGGLVPTAAVVNIYSQKLYLLLMTITDPFTRKPRNVMVAWDQNEWTVQSQGPSLIAIGTQEIASDLEAWGTDGVHLYKLFARPSETLAKVVSTKQWGGQASFMTDVVHSLYLSAESQVSGSPDLSFSGSIDAEGLAVPFENSVTMALVSCPPGSYPFSAPLDFVAALGAPAMYGCGAGAGLPQVPGTALGVTLVTFSPDLILRNISLGLIEVTAAA